MNKEIDIEIYTDGGCNPNPGEGGWGAIIIYNDTQTQKKSDDYHLSGYEKESTNNKMELTAVIKALQFINNTQRIKKDILIYTDSQYVKNGITKWIKNWKLNGWKTSNRKPVKNKELWEDLDYHRQVHNVKFQWVKAHNGNKYNEIADELATNAILYKGNEDFSKKNKLKNQVILLDDDSEIILDNTENFKNDLIGKIQKDIKLLDMNTKEIIVNDITKDNLESLQKILNNLEHNTVQLKVCLNNKNFNNKKGK